LKKELDMGTEKGKRSEDCDGRVRNGQRGGRAGRADLT
jgi:hypothetical protein